MHKTFLIIINCENRYTAFVKTVIYFSSGVLDEQKVQKNSIYNKSFVTINVFTVTFDQFNVPLLNKSSNLISSKILTDLKPLNGSVRQNKTTNSLFQIIFQPSMDLQLKFHGFGGEYLGFSGFTSTQFCPCTLSRTGLTLWFYIVTIFLFEFLFF